MQKSVKTEELQAVFDRVATHLIKQGRRSMMPAAGSPDILICAYRGENGSSCAVGCLILDEHYSPDLEGNSIHRLAVQTALMLSGIDLGVVIDGRIRIGLNTMGRMLAELQRAHDTAPDDGFSMHIHEPLRRIAQAHHLSTECLTEPSPAA